MRPTACLVPAIPVVVLVLAVGGCRSVTTQTVSHYPPPQPAEAPAAVCPAAAVCPTAADHVYVFVVNGADPLNLAGVDRLANKIRESGYPHTRTASWVDEKTLERQARAIRQTDPAARFALIGHSAGTYTVKRVAARLVADGVPVVMVGYVGGDYLRDTAATRLPGVGQVVNVTGDGYLLTGRNLFFNGTDVTGAQNVRLAGTRHFDLPTHPNTFAMLYAGLTAATSETMTAPLMTHR